MNLPYKISFPHEFKKLTGHEPFPWQEALFERFQTGNIPSSCSIPTGLGKTSVIAIWLLALIEKANVPRRLVYVVNRRTVVDQTTEEAIKLKTNSQNIDLAISTLRGQFADNRDWSADPSRTAVICGTVDMIGSRLLFSGYGCGFKTKPLHAGFLGQDVLLVHDEAHLEPAFQELIDRIEEEQRKHEQSKDAFMSKLKLRVMSLTATARNDQVNGYGESSKSFNLTEEEQNPPDRMPDQPTKPVHHVWRRLKAKKTLRLHKIKDEKQLSNNIVELALEHKDSNSAVLIYIRKIEDLKKIREKLEKNFKIVELSGVIRGRERDDLVETPVFKRFLKGGEPAPTVFMLCTSAGEVGIDLSADHMICDLTPFDSMAQRFGRVNRFGHGEAFVDVVYPEKFNEKDKLKTARKKTLELLQSLQGDVSPHALMTRLDKCEKESAFTPAPTILPANEILFDAWALTTIREKMPGRPPVEPYLHGIRDWEPPETYVAWREEVDILNEKELRKLYTPDDLVDLLEDYPLKPHELLRDRSDRIFKELGKLAKVHSDAPVWKIDSQGQIEVSSLFKLTSGNSKDIEWATIVLPPTACGLSESGTLDGEVVSKKEIQYDVADEWYTDDDPPKNHRIRDRKGSRNVDSPPQMRLVRIIDTKPGEDENETDGERFWHWYVRPLSADDEISKTAIQPILWDDHTNDVMIQTEKIADKLGLPSDLKQALIFAARYHDLGKKRDFWQRSIGNSNSSEWYAKSGKSVKSDKPCIPLNICPDYRHEFGSLQDVLNDKNKCHAEYKKLSDDMKELALHLIAAHHGYARPHFPAEKAVDRKYEDTKTNQAAIEATRRFARLQRKYGRWGLAYLESLLRAADYAASARPSNSENKEATTT
ncbi:MAG: type I-U CRISPR-associated helicase/endonuclease Cas3 [Candidatus Omnitrophica bacterium]|nr:type I-U CRISPR-associated helicase/endonuclease Cas3 [Candidatus Omnitrophota bacterium]